MSITKPFTFVAGTKARANEVNQNFDVLYSQVNSNISAINTNANDIDTLNSNKANVNGSPSQPFNVLDINITSTTQAVNAQSMRISLTPLYGYIDGYVISKDSGNPNNTILVTPGSCYDSTKKIVLTKDTSTTKQNTSQGASITYYVYVIGNNSGSSVDILISDLSVTPLLPEGYTKFRQIGNYTTDSSSNIQIISNYSNSVSATTIVNSIAPDYSKAYSVGLPYTAPYDGYMSITVVSNGSTATAKVEGVAVASAQNTGGDNRYTDQSTSVFSISKNQRVTIGGQSSYSAKFIPMKGGI